MQLAVQRNNALSLINGCRRAGPDDVMLKQDAYDLAKYLGQVMCEKDKANAKKVRELEARLEALEARPQTTPRG